MWVLLVQAEHRLPLLWCLQWGQLSGWGLHLPSPSLMLCTRED